MLLTISDWKTISPHTGVVYWISVGGCNKRPFIQVAFHIFVLEKTAKTRLLFDKIPIWIFPKK